jgi:hypothetical protein
MKIKHAIAVAVSTLVIAGGASAQSLDFTLDGDITPGSCTPTFAGGSSLNFGSINSAAIQAAQVFNVHYVHPNYANMTLNVACQSPTRVVLSFADNKAASNTRGAGAGFGLGTSGGADIGSASIWWTGGTFDGVGPVSGLSSSDSGATWTESGFGIGITPLPGYQYSAIKTAGLTTPDTVTNASYTFTAQALISQALSLSSQVILNGAATVTVSYL